MLGFECANAKACKVRSYLSLTTYFSAAALPLAVSDCLGEWRPCATSTSRNRAVSSCLGERRPYATTSSRNRAVSSCLSEWRPCATTSSRNSAVSNCLGGRRPCATHAHATVQKTPCNALRLLFYLLTFILAGTYLPYLLLAAPVCNLKLLLPVPGLGLWWVHAGF